MNETEPRSADVLGLFDHERLDVYNVALDFVVLADSIAEAIPSGRAYLAEQLRRASSSVVLNIAEGAGEFSRNEKARFYRIALRSATESAATLDVLRRLKLGGDADLKDGRGMLLRIAAMLSRLARRGTSRGNRRPGTGRGTGTGTGIDRGTGRGREPNPTPTST